MPRHPALQCLRALRQSFIAVADGERHTITTVGEALRFLVNLPAKLDGMHWTMASGGLLWAYRDAAGIKHATEAFENALLTDKLLIAIGPAD